MKRLVYSPKAFVYIQTDQGVYNISDLVVSGNVHRKVNQVSTAEVTFQNPNRQFTQPGDPTFRPMDKITIFLQRLPGFPVQSFTGYLDATPYYQMYPGTCTIKASCTLKRLQYTYFDPGLPFMMQFMSRYGWLTDGNGTLTSPQRAQGNETVDQAQSASMSDLMFASLKHIAGWDPQQIYIEQLPSGLTDRIHEIYDALHEENEESSKEFKQWLKDFIGDGSAGGGGISPALSGISLSNLSQEQNTVLDTLLSVAASMNAPRKYQLAAISTGLVESNLRNLNYGDADSKGWRQERVSIYGDGPDGATNVAAGAKRYYNECKQHDHGQSAGELAADVQRPAAQYRGRYTERLSDAEALLNQYEAKKGGEGAGPGGTDQQADGSDTAVKPGRNNADRPSAGNTGVKTGTRYDAIVAECNRLTSLANSGLKYSNSRPPSDTQGYDCSSSTSQVLKAAGYKLDGWPATNTIKQYMKPGKDPTGRVTFWNSDRGNLAGNSVHIWIEVEGRPFTTADHLSAHWKDDYYAKSNPAAYGFEPFHVDGLDQPADIPADANTSSGGGGDSTGAGDALQAAKAASVFTALNFPQAVSSAESMLLKGSDARGRSLMNDQPLLPFVEQLAKGSLRSFMSLPNGDFYSWHPDYFGAFGTAPYWDIDDIEVLDGNITLSDEALITHVFVTGATLPTQQIDITRKIQTHGVVNILNAGSADFLNLDPDSAKTAQQAAQTARTDGRAKTPAKEADLQPFLGSIDAALAFLSRYGARPYVEDAPFIRSHLFETFYAYQTFMLAWARQFMTAFSFTFMPEMYPGGLVKFKDHDIQMYVDEVHHSFDYSSGFTTQANLSAPSSTDEAHKNISRGMIRAWNNRKDLAGNP